MGLIVLGGGLRCRSVYLVFFLRCCVIYAVVVVVWVIVCALSVARRVFVVSDFCGAPFGCQDGWCSACEVFNGSIVGVCYRTCGRSGFTWRGVGRLLVLVLVCCFRVCGYQVDGCVIYIR